MTFLENIHSISHLDIVGVQGTLQTFKEETTVHSESTPMAFSNEIEYQYYIQNIDLASFLGAKSRTKVICPFCGANCGYISYYEKQQRWIFQCFAEKITCNIIGMVQRLAKCSYSQAVEFIHQVYNISFTATEQEAQLKRIISHNLTVTNGDTYEQHYPQTFRFLKSHSSLLPEFYRKLQTLHNRPLWTMDGEPVMMLTNRELRELLCVSDGKARVFARELCLLGYIRAIPLHELSEDSQARIKELKGKSQNQKECPMVYDINLLSPELLNACEASAEWLNAQRVTKGSLTLKSTYALFGGDEGRNIISPNYSKKKRGYAEWTAYDGILKYQDILITKIREKGYVLERNLPQKLRLVRRTSFGERYSVFVTWLEVRSAVIAACNCICVPANKDQLKLLNITDKTISGNLIVPVESAYTIERQVGEILNRISLYSYVFTKDFLPEAKANRKAFREMLDMCGIKSVRLNDHYRKKFGITESGQNIDILVDASI